MCKIKNNKDNNEVLNNTLLPKQIFTLNLINNSLLLWRKGPQIFYQILRKNN